MHAFNTLAHLSTRSRNLLRALALASLAAAGFALPFVWDVLGAINEMPKMHWLQSLLSIEPPISWLMMFIWGSAIPLVLLLAMHQAPAHRLRNAVLVLVLMWLAVTWYVHMPASGMCPVFYPSAELACTALQWGYSLSLGIATATYVFAMLALGFSALGLLAESLEEDPVQAS